MAPVCAGPGLHTQTRASAAVSVLARAGRSGIGGPGRSAAGGAWFGVVALGCSFRLGGCDGQPPGWVARLDLGSGSGAVWGASYERAAVDDLVHARERVRADQQLHRDR